MASECRSPIILGVEMLKRIIMLGVVLLAGYYAVKWVDKSGGM
jgi:hypothetical protein